MRRRTIPMLAMLLTGCAAARYPLNLPLRAEVAPEVGQRARAVDRDLPPEGSRDRLLAQALIAGAAPGAPGPSGAFAEQLLRGDVGLAFETSAGGEPAFHELTAGLVDLPFAGFVGCFEPAREWGRRLASYRGGELVVDQTDARGRVILQRERMVISMPWYAVGGPDMDMSKYEVIERAERSTTVLWWAALSENGSVFHDDGYVTFKAVEAGGRERTLVFFNSIHRIDPGWGGALLPGGMRAALTRAALRDTFLAHLESYRAAIETPAR